MALHKTILLLALSLFLGCATNTPRSTLTPSRAVSPQASTSGSDVLASIPFTLHDNRLLVDVFLNGQGPFVMVFDTGGANTLTPEVMRILDLHTQGQEFVTGAGEKKVPSHSVHVHSMQVGGFKLEDQKFMVLNLTPIRRTFRFPHLDGIIGYELLQQAKVRLDMDRQQIQLVRQDAPLLSGASILKFDLAGKDPVIDGKINGTPARILLDTGDRSNLTLFRKFAHQSKLEQMFERRESMLTGMGVGGPIKGKLASVDKVDLGPAEVNDVLARLPLTKGGYFYQSDISASAGMGLLKAFNMEFDYKNGVVALQRRKDFKEPSTFVPISR